MDFNEELTALMAAQAPLIQLITYEEERVLKIISSVPVARELGIISWDIADGFTVHRAGREPFATKDCTTDTILPHLAEKLPQGSIVVLKDFHHCWNQKRGYITRKLRNMAAGLRAKSQYFIFITPPLPAEQDLPRELKDDVVVMQIPLPDSREIGQLFDEITHRLDKNKLPRKELKEKILQSALGLTTNQARLAFSQVWAKYQRFDDQSIEMVTRAKRQVIRESGALEFWPADMGEANVGGLDLMKRWFHLRQSAFTEDARQAGLPFPRGVSLIGIPGTGKSLSAKMLSGLWKLPLLRLDVGTLFGSLLGESEQNMRKAIMLAETVSPCILWIDEMEKAFAGSGAGTLNSGAATRVFGTFLTWMQEHHTPVFVLATANDVSALPPELMNRFDRTFFLDLPNAAERRAIFNIHLKNAGESFPERKFNMDQLVRQTQDFVGREIERVVREAQFAAYADGNREIESNDLLQAIKETVPLSKSHSEVIESLRKWKTEGRAFPASSGEVITGKISGGRVIETM